MPPFLSLYYLCHINPHKIMELLRYFYHPDHASTWFSTSPGSSSWISDSRGSTIQHLHYLPFGEDWVDQRNSYWSAPYTFSGKEKDVETGYNYFGARYYNSELSIWHSVDPMSDKYPSMSPYNYCANNPVMLVDPDGREFGDFYTYGGVKLGTDGIEDGKVKFVNDPVSLFLIYNYQGGKVFSKDLINNIKVSSETTYSELATLAVQFIKSTWSPYSERNWVMQPYPYHMPIFDVCPDIRKVPNGEKACDFIFNLGLAGQSSSFHIHNLVQYINQYGEGGNTFAPSTIDMESFKLFQYNFIAGWNPETKNFGAAVYNSNSSRLGVLSIDFIFKITGFSGYDYMLNINNAK